MLGSFQLVMLANRSSWTSDAALAIDPTRLGGSHNVLASSSGGSPCCSSLDSKMHESTTAACMSLPALKSAQKTSRTLPVSSKPNVTVKDISLPSAITNGTRPVIDG